MSPASDAPRKPSETLPAPRAGTMEITERGITPRTLEELYRYAQYVHAAQAAPDGLDTPEKILVAIQTGMEVGLRPQVSVRSLYVINGMAQWRGESALGLVRTSGQLAHLSWDFAGSRPDLSQKLDGFADDYECVVSIQRKGGSLREFRFSVGDAKLAGLWGVRTWKTHPKRMLRWRALGEALQAEFSDVLGGMYVHEAVIGELDEETRAQQARDVTPAREAPQASREPVSAPEGADPVFEALGGSQEPEDAVLGEAPERDDTPEGPGPPAPPDQPKHPEAPAEQQPESPPPAQVPLLDSSQGGATGTAPLEDPTVGDSTEAEPSPADPEPAVDDDGLPDPCAQWCETHEAWFETPDCPQCVHELELELAAEQEQS